jgi:hypothetical protein
MQPIQTLRNEKTQPSRGQVYRTTERDDPRPDDRPPSSFVSERYSAWSATSIFNFVPFSSPSGR